MAIDIDCVDDEERFGGFAPAEVEARGEMHSLISDRQVESASARVKKSGVLEMLTEWHKLDNPRQGQSGRPALIREHALLVGLLLLAQEHSPLFMRSLATMFQYCLSPASSALLGIPETIISLTGKSSEKNRWEKNTNNSFHRMLDLMEPFPMHRRYSLTYTQVKEVLDNHDPEREALMKRRLDLFTNSLLLMTFREQPRRIQRATKKLDISFDQTFLEPRSKVGYSPRTLSQRIREENDPENVKPRPGPVDPFAGWYPKKGERPDIAPGGTDTTSPTKANKSQDLGWGWMANIAVRVDSEDPDTVRFPKIAISATMSLPNVGVSEEAVELMRAALGTNLPPGLADADKQYWANARPERLHSPAKELGWTASTDYRVDRLGPSVNAGDAGSKGGIEFIEDEKYCPGTPPALKSATLDLVNGTIDEETFQIRRGERRAFQVHSKERPDAKGRQPFSCPARGNSPTVTCAVLELLMTKTGKTLPKVADKERPRVPEEFAPKFVPAICRQHSVSLNKEDGIRGEQGLPYRSKEWDKFHKHARNSIESLNAGVKDSREHRRCRASARPRVRRRAGFRDLPSHQFQPSQDRIVPRGRSS